MRSMKMKKDTGQRIKKLREGRTNLTQPEAAEEFAVSKDTYMGWERGKNFPPPPKMSEIADKYGVTMDWLYLGKEIANGELTQREKQLLMFFRRLSDEKQDQAIISVAVIAAEQD